MPREPSARSNLLTSTYQSTVFSGLLAEVGVTGVAARGLADVVVRGAADVVRDVAEVARDAEDVARDAPDVVRDVPDLVGWVV